MNKYLKLSFFSILGLATIFHPSLVSGSDIYPPVTESRSNQPRKVKRISPFLSNKNNPNNSISGEINRQQSPKSQPQLKTDVTRNIYSCINYENKTTTIVDTARGRIKLIVWESDYFANSGWTPQKRCEAVSARFQKFSDNKSLKYVSTGVVKEKYKVICVSSPQPGRGYNCNNDGLLLTLQPNDNPSKVLKTLFVNATKVGGTAVVRGETAVSIDRILQRSAIIPVKETTVNTETIVEQPIVNQQQQSSTNSTEIKIIQPRITTPSICTPPLCD